MDADTEREKEGNFKSWSTLLYLLNHKTVAVLGVFYIWSTNYLVFYFFAITFQILGQILKNK